MRSKLTKIVGIIAIMASVITRIIFKNITIPNTLLSQYENVPEMSAKAKEFSNTLLSIYLYYGDILFYSMLIFIGLIVISQFIVKE